LAHENVHRHRAVADRKRGGKTLGSGSIGDVQGVEDAEGVENVEADQVERRRGHRAVLPLAVDAMKETLDVLIDAVGLAGNRPSRKI